MSRTPDFRVTAFNKDTGLKSRTRVGVAWQNEDGTLDLYFDPYITIQGGPDMLIRLWPQEGASEEDDTSTKRKRTKTRRVRD